MATDTVNRAQATSARLEPAGLPAFAGIESDNMIRRIGTALRGLNGTPGRDIEEAYRHCAAITRQFSKSFYFSTGFLPPQTRRAIRAFYAFCRLTDDLVDAPGRSTRRAPGRTTAQDIAEWRHQARLPAGAQRHPVLYAWADTRDRFQVPQQHVEELIDGCVMDLTTNRYQTFDDLRLYCYRVASTVGLISMHIIGLQDNSPKSAENARTAAIELGIALQLTNILRDVGEDLALGRVYLPQEDLQRFGYTEADLRSGVIDDRFRALMRFEIARANQLYEENLPGIICLRPEGRLAVGAAILLYRGILNRIVDNGFDVFRKRAYLTTFEKIRMMPSIQREIARLVNQTPA